MYISSWLVSGAQIFPTAAGGEEGLARNTYLPGEGKSKGNGTVSATGTGTGTGTVLVTGTVTVVIIDYGL